jgi:hypothetical protein
MSETLLGLKQCPKCYGENLIRVNAGEVTNFFCEGCTMCWHLDGDRASLVDSRMCPGCELRALGWWCG